MTAHVELARAYRAKGRLGDELDLWQRRVKADPKDAIAHQRLGWVLWFTGRAKEGLPWLGAGAEMSPGDPWAHFYLGNANLALGDCGEAERMYRKALAFQSDHSSAQAGVIWSLLAGNKDQEARSELHQFQTGTFDGDRYPLKLADLEYFLGDHKNASLHAREALAEPDERYWPRGFLASTIFGALLWRTDRVAAEDHLGESERIDLQRLDGGDEGYMPHIDLAAVRAIRGDVSAGCDSLRTAMTLGWHYPALATRERLFESLRASQDFRSLVAS